MDEFFTDLASYKIIIIISILASIGHIILSIILKKLTVQAKKTTNKLDDYLIIALSMPLKTLALFTWFYFTVSLLEKKMKLLTSMTDYINITPIFIITWAIIRMISSIECYLLERKEGINSDSVKLIIRLIKILVIFSILLGIAQRFGFSISSLLTFGGVGGVVMGLAAKDMLANIFGGLMIQMDKPFSTGDWIRSTKFEGEVEKIGWRMTRIRTFSKNPVYIPNSIFTSIPIETPSRMSNRRINETIGVRYDDIAKIPIIVTEIQTLLHAEEKIDQSQPLRVYFNHFNASSLDFKVYAFTKTINKNEYQCVKQIILLKIADIISKHGAQIAYPTQTLYIENT